MAKTTSINPRPKSTSTSCLRIGTARRDETRSFAGERADRLDLLELPVFEQPPARTAWMVCSMRSS